MDVGAEGLNAASLVLLEQRRAGEADQHSPRQQGLHGVVEFAGLGAVAFVHEDEDLAFRVKAFGQVAADVPDERVNVAFLRGVELLHQRTNQPLLTGIEYIHQIGAAFCAMNLLADPLKISFYLLIQFGSISNKQYPGVSDIFANPLRQPDHSQALAAALGMPDDATFPAFHMFLGRFYSEVLIMPTDLFDA